MRWRVKKGDALGWNLLNNKNIIRGGNLHNIHNWIPQQKIYILKPSNIPSDAMLLRKVWTYVAKDYYNKETSNFYDG